VWWHGADDLTVRARFTGPDGTEQLVPLEEASGLGRWSGAVVPSAAGWWTLRIEAIAGARPTFDIPRPVFADPPRAAASVWYSLFPRSTGGRDATGRPVHGTLRTAAADLPRIAALGVDVVHLTPIHPIGTTRRKGRDGAPQAGPDDPGCPWAIGSADGGHDAVHPQLGTVADVRALVAEARQLGLHVALELALQCSPDHPWVREHPTWFGNGTMDAAITERGWTDVVSLDFDAEPDALATEAQRVVEFWIAAGVRTFRVDNPHTKPAAFWHRLIWRLKDKYPDVVFLAEAFTRPALQEGLSALGFSQTLTYFMWREGAPELAEFAADLQRLADIARPNLFPANHDVLPASLRDADARTFAVRAALAATLAASWGIPSGYELVENEPSGQGHSWQHAEKFELRPRHFDNSDPFLVDTITALNRARRDHSALQQVRGLQIRSVDNPQLLAYHRHDPLTGDTVLCVVTLDPHHPQHGNVATGDLGPAVRDVLTGARIAVHDDTVPVTIDPQQGVVALLVPDLGAAE
jgi:starch synthase (maltosyl-transferring)